jgi:predicted MFS family arabinose efflux permease
MTVVFLIVVGLVAHAYVMGLRTFQLLFLCALGFRAVSLLAQSAMKVGRVHAAHEMDIPHLNQLKVIGKSPSLLLFILFGMVWGFASNCFGPFYSVFLFRELNLSPANMTILVVLTSVALALSFPGWGKLLDRFGNTTIMIVSIASIQLQNYLWCFLTPHNTWMLYPMYIWGGYADGGFLLGQFNLLLKLAPPEAKILAIGLNLAGTSLIMALAAIVGGQFLVWGRSAGYSGLTVYHAAFLFQPTLCILSCLLLLGIREPRASGFRRVIRSLLTLSTMSSVLGFGTLRQIIAWRSTHQKREPQRPGTMGN